MSSSRQAARRASWSIFDERPTTTIGAALAAAVGRLASDHHAVLLANHGPVVAGTDLSAATDAIEELEETARLYLLLHGRELTTLTDAQVGQAAFQAGAIAGAQVPVGQQFFHGGNFGRACAGRFEHDVRAIFEFTFANVFEGFFNRIADDSGAHDLGHFQLSS